ncbi:MAG: protoheme IX farnesyltransferase, partial [Saprospiraceae bacterium]
FLIPLYYILGLTPMIMILLILSMLIFAYYGYLLYKNNDRASARKLMFCSIIYLPVVLLLFILNTYLV